MKNLVSKLKLQAIIACLLLAVVVSSCTWEHDGEIVKDINGNLYRLESSGYRHESYDLKPLPTAKIDSFINNR